MAELPKYFYFRLHSKNKGTTVEIEDASDVDVVEVVRCRDCIHRSTCYQNREISENGYCNYGERNGKDSKNG